LTVAQKFKRPKNIYVACRNIEKLLTKLYFGCSKLEELQLV